MKDYMKSMSIIGLVLVALVIIGGIFYFSSMSSNNPYPNTGTGQAASNSLVTTYGNTPDNSNNSSNSNTGAGNTGTNSNTNPQVLSVSISGFAFSPSPLTIHTGDTVKWTNMDSAPHTVTSDSGSELSSSSLSRGQAYAHTFLVPGTYFYHCSIHPSMTGEIIVN